MVIDEVDGNEPGVAKIAAESRRQKDEQSRIYLYGRLKDVEKELADKDNMIEELAQEAEEIFNRA